MSPGLLTFACSAESCPAAEFRGVTRGSLDGAESSSSVPETIHMIFDI